MKRREFLKSAAAASVAVACPPAQTALAQAQPAPQSNPPSQPAAPMVYPLGPDSKRQPGVPQGKQFSFTMEDSRFFPGTRRTIDVYVPAQYMADRPACVLVGLDHLGDTEPIVLDNLIHRKELPVIIGIGLHPGEVLSSNPPQNPRFNRSFEFDSLSPVLAEFILEEVLPAVERQKTPDGLPIRLSSNPNDRAIKGGSTGGIGSFTVAWQRPDAFRRVFTAVGTFVGMRGGDRYPVLVRKTEPKPIRIFLQDGSKDGWPGGLEFGDWWMSNQEMERSLTFSGYEVNHVWGILGHEGTQSESIQPEAMRWLWKDWPQPVQAGWSQNSALRAVLQPGEEWKPALINPALPAPAPRASLYSNPPVLDAHSTAASLASDSRGRVIVQDPSSGRILRIQDDGNTTLFTQTISGAHPIAFGPNDRLYVAEASKARVLAIEEDGSTKTIAEGVRGAGLTVTHEGNVYVTEADSGRLWLIRPTGGKSVVAQGLNDASGVALTPDGLWMFVAQSSGHRGYGYRVQPDGELQCGEPLYWFHVPDTANDCGAGQIAMDCSGYAYTATRMGVQIFDRNGRVRAILPIENHQLAGICFGGADRQTLYVSTGHAVYRRRMKAVGAPAWEAPIVLPAASGG